ncbi:MAG: hypothetical protein C0601_07625 [Candidatus Muiribacterium halophilum]|uniref:DEAD/DEAH box helicase n=1 Tax=Muiribacterium halophilum TaxID=2053465 RepID=A0A2N5ZFL5_MUIH1|nr:MAG: hypothetical protein C0601_07625 [Candidatus Muirbacterium halophilum]
MQYKGLIMDDFQVQAVEDLGKGKSVVVAAPTGCGKTLIAEYLIENFLQEGERAVYTAPIKALSNQKYRDFSRLYGDKVGILTGDISINPGAQVLIMTTEIFRNMLFAEKEELSDVSHVIFDEVHYINDLQRGVIWEESIIFALPQMRFLALSATIPNAHELAGWIRDIKKHEVSLIEKKERPVPLFHNVFSKRAGIVTIEKFLKTYSTKTISLQAKKYSMKNINLLVSALKNKDRLPAICFVFSREGCFRYAKETAKQFDFLSKEEKARVQKTLDEVAEKYSISNSPSFQMIKKLALKGIGVHNAGILPVMKEVIEVFFGEGILRVIFVTETFAVGVNMPAKTAVFASLEKYDGIEFRYMKNNEYFQMAGRAGRRGIDEKGHVVSMMDSSFLKIDEVVRIMDEKRLEPLESQFKLSYNTVLNLVDQYENAKIREILNMSFAQYLDRSKKEELKEKIDGKQEIIDESTEEMECLDYEEFKKFHSLSRKKFKYSAKLKEATEAIQSGKYGKRRITKFRRDQTRSRQRLNRINKKLKALKCTNCPDQRKCRNISSKIRKYNRRINEIKQKVEENRVDYFQMFLKKKKFLEKAGYVEGNDLTARGKMGSRIYGYELMVVELAFDGVIETFSADDINILCACMVYELNPKKDGFLRVEIDETYHNIRKAKKIVASIRKEEIRFGIEPGKQIYLDIIPAAKAWTKGAEFSQLLSLTHLSEGDIIRLFRQVIDLLQQIKRVYQGHDSVVSKLNEAMDKVNRDIVNVSEQLD